MRDDWEAVIGLEVHAQLATASKMFSGASTAYGAEPNTLAGLVDAALPGTLPVPNREAIAMAIRFGLAIDAEIAPASVFARKNYFYPDLPKGYQISQYDQPIVGRGRIAVRRDDGSELIVPIARAHLEEDAGKSLHDAFHGATAIDLNRAGVPLLEIVTEPELHGPGDAVACMRAIHRLVRWLGICDGNMQEGSFRCDANVSVRRRGEAKLGTRAEIKNVNSFRFVEKAVAYEIERQIRTLEGGGAVVQETRLYDEAQNRTRPMRGKESAHDYRYFPDPDLPPLLLGPAQLARERAAMPELPDARRLRYAGSLGLSDYDATQLTLERDVSDYFEALLGHGAAPKLAANWI
ncbi:MAG TPA: Asp-tRNA(Asn)/Glu-tRNA(Gln) amidotransferase subunit GatB, partial [Xanthomonadales bacterium]|nr:Asp-tRNA(Asn)/Glu-tRNA(Gln) amidotransferase subunit GatB [Xanthomonadales bacterium]